MVTFRFVRKEDPTITASLYLNNLADIINHELAAQKSVNLKLKRLNMQLFII